MKLTSTNKATYSQALMHGTGNWAKSDLHVSNFSLEFYDMWQSGVEINPLCISIELLCSKRCSTGLLLHKYLKALEVLCYSALIMVMCSKYAVFDSTQDHHILVCTMYISAAQAQKVAWFNDDTTSISYPTGHHSGWSGE